MLDWILAAIFIFAAFTGFRKGFLKSLIGLFGNLIALAGSYVLAAPVTVWLNEQFGIAGFLAGYIRDLLPMPDNFSVLLASFEGLGQLYTYLDQSFLPDSLKQSILAAVQEQVNAVGAGVYATMADIVELRLLLLFCRVLCLSGFGHCFVLFCFLSAMYWQVWCIWCRW